MIMSDKDFLKKIDILYEQKAELYNQISENKRNFIHMLIDNIMKYDIKFIVNDEQSIKTEKSIDEAIEKIKEW